MHNRTNKPEKTTQKKERKINLLIECHEWVREGWLS